MAILLLWVLIAALLDPRGDFPLNDDWSYGAAVRGLLAGEGFRPTDWTAMPLLLQALWGALFCLPGGFSFVALRLSTLTAGLFALYALYQLVLDSGGSRGRARFAAALLALNPLFLPLAFSFMSDLPFLALWSWALLFLARDLRARSRGALVAGTLLALGATLTRQAGLALPAAFLLASLFAGDRTWRCALRAALPLLSACAALIIYHTSMAQGPGLPALYGHRWGLLTEALRSPPALALDLAGGLLKSLLYLGLFLGPALLLTRGSRRPRVYWPVLLLLAGGLLYWRRLLPLLPNIIDPAGIGPPTLATETLPAPLPSVFWIAVTLMALAAGAALATRGGIPGTRRLNHLLVSLGLLYLLPILATGLFDRYFLPLLPPALVFVLSAEPRRSPLRPWAAWGALILLGGYALAGSHDYLGWNRARWTLLDRYEAAGGLAADMDGGFEYNNLRRVERGAGGLGLSAAPTGATHRLAFEASAGWRTLEIESYRRWLPPGRGRVLIEVHAAGRKQPP